MSGKGWVAISTVFPRYVWFYVVQNILPVNLPEPSMDEAGFILTQTTECWEKTTQTRISEKSGLVCVRINVGL